MQNIQKYFLILESLQYGHSSDDADKNLKSNLDILQKYLKYEDLNSSALPCRLNGYPPDESCTESWKCACYLFHVITTITSNVNLDSNEREQLISVRNQNELFNAIKLASRYGIVYNLSEVLHQHPIFSCSHGNKRDIGQLKTSLKILSELFLIATIASSRVMESVILEVMAGAYICKDHELLTRLDILWERTPKENYFRYLLILKSIKNLEKEVQEALHKDLLRKLVEPEGLKLLILNTVPSVNGSVEIPNWKRYDVVARIIAHKGHSDSFYKQMIEQIFIFIKNSIFDVMESNLVPAGVVTLRKLYSLNDNTRTEIEGRIKQFFKPFLQPDDIIAGLIVKESSEVQEFIKLLCTLFNGSSFEALPSAILVNYLPVLISLFTLTEGYPIAKDLTVLISQCLANRSTEELRIILESLFKKEKKSPNLEYLHERIGIKQIDEISQYQLQIMPQDFESTTDLPSGLVRILKTCNNNILAYNCFIEILMIFEETETTAKFNTGSGDLLQTEEELDEFLARKFQARLSVITCLTELISFRQFHSQFRENPDGVLKFLQNALEKRINADPGTFDSDENLPVLLAVFQEFIESAKDYSKYQVVRKSLEKYLKLVKNDELKHQIQTIVTTLDGSPNTAGLACSDYSFARSLLSESQSHLRVYGITQLIKLLTNRDEEAISNRHSILAMAMITLRDEESYTYLNCVRLLVCLVNFMQAEVLETLSAEYLNENENIEFRLKVGEAILKVTEDLGPISYNYKDVLVNCFLAGARNKINEFRTSSMANLSTVCRLLSYQVHNFFHEMMLLIEATLQTDTYLPARRASVLILSQLLWGMDNLVDFQETLLPIYRLLTAIVQNDKDEKTRVHATNGLSYLKNKCKAFLFQEPNMEKEIKIFGIKDNSEKKGHILELCK